jgi:hypothetical protein
MTGWQDAVNTGQKQKRNQERHEMKMTFEEVKVVETFTYRGQRFQKCALSMAEDERGWGNIFVDEIVVEREGQTAARDVEPRVKT